SGADLDTVKSDISQLQSHATARHDAVIADAQKLAADAQAAVGGTRKEAMATIKADRAKLKSDRTAAAATLKADRAKLKADAAVAAGRFDSEQALRNFLFGPKLVRAEIVVRDAQGLHDYRIDRGRVLRVRADAILLRERDGTTVSVPLAPRVRVRVDGAVVAL